MDANGQRFWSLAGEQAWVRQGAPPPVHDSERRTFRLGSHRELGFTESPDEAEERRGRPRMTHDRHGTHAFVDPVTNEIHGAGALSGSVVLHAPDDPVIDVAVGYDEVLYFIEEAEVWLVDLRGRWDAVAVSLPDFAPSRLAARPEGGVWVLDRNDQQLARVTGVPLPREGARERSDLLFDPKEENPRPPRMVRVDLGSTDAEEAIDIATNSRGRTVLLSWEADASSVRFVASDGSLGPRQLLDGIERPFSIGFVDVDTLAVLVAALHTEAEGGPLVPGGTQVVTYDGGPSDEAGSRLPLGGTYPLLGHDGGPFARGLDEPVRYGVTGSEPVAPAPRRLIQIAAPRHAMTGNLVTPPGAPLDGGREGFEWHRAYVEAHFPPGCGLRLYVRASDEPVEPAEEHEHVFGDVEPAPGLPHGIWSTMASELPFHDGVLPCPLEPHRAGLFTVLLQRTGRAVTAIRGRYLWVRVELVGDGRLGPELAAVRIYGSRFSHVENYLPRIYHDNRFGTDADAPGAASPADFLERFVGNFEGVLTTLEDRIANAHLLTDPQTCPEDALGWLSSWVGLVFDAAYPAERRRVAIEHAMALHRWRGTARGLRMAIDLLTGGAVERGKVVILEGWRLRRTFATILGADLADEDDPLLGGVVQSGNSVVGDSLILGDDFRREFVALFRENLPERPSGSTLDEWIQWMVERYIDPHVVDAFFDRLAHRLTILVHAEDTELLTSLRKIVELETPAHLETEVVSAPYPFLVGMASLVGVDTFLRGPEEPPGIVVGESRIGGTGFLSRPAALDSRLEGGTT
ncbi:MAG: phage tail protein [Myxococcota bacterium]